MKRLRNILAILSLSVTMACADNNKVTKDTGVLPAASRQFISEHFGDIAVSHIQIEKNLVLTDSYDVILTDGTNVEFNRKGEWKEVNRHNLSVPGAIIPEAIRTYVRQNYPSAMIVAIDKDFRDYEIDLNNGLELKFDLQGNLVDFD